MPASVLPRGAIDTFAGPPVAWLHPDGESGVSTFGLRLHVAGTGIDVSLEVGGPWRRPGRASRILVVRRLTILSDHETTVQLQADVVADPGGNAHLELQVIDPPHPGPFTRLVVRALRARLISGLAAAR